MNTKNPLLIIIRGLPGSGKTYLAAKLQHQLGTERVVMLDPDATDYDSQEYQEHVRHQIVEGVDPKLHAYRYLRAQAYKGIADKRIIIWNQPFTNLEIFNKMMANLRLQASEHHTKLTVLVVEVEIDPDEARVRVTNRKLQGGHGPSEATFERFTHEYVTFAHDGYDTVTVKGTGDVAVAVTAIISALNTLQAAA